MSVQIPIFGGIKVSKNYRNLTTQKKFLHKRNQMYSLLRSKSKMKLANLLTQNTLYQLLF